MAIEETYTARRNCEVKVTNRAGESFYLEYDEKQAFHVAARESSSRYRVGEELDDPGAKRNFISVLHRENLMRAIAIRSVSNRDS